ncbi:MAG: ribokinase [Firmicutes bacterium HGW-Firmicutes-16]|nr:MAG: ribokinase [Firmicutes bacterium HGW-Firmicutes-16]
MKKLVLGSLNIDKTYSVASLVKPKETIAAQRYESFCGGKGFNQAVALARAGSEVFFAGVVGNDGEAFMHALAADGIRTDYIRRSNNPNGHAVIQVDSEGQNSIIIVSGSNAEVTETYIDEVISNFTVGDLIILQNEISCVGYVINEANKKGLIIAFNPSPFSDAVKTYDMTKVDILLVNEIEGAAICGAETVDEILNALHEMYPNLSVLLTKGADGSAYIDAKGEKDYCGAIVCEAVDTTAAGDTFTGYFLHELFNGEKPVDAMRVASIASGISVTRKGASPSIPFSNEVLIYAEKHPAKHN